MVKTVGKVTDVIVCCLSSDTAPLKTVRLQKLRQISQSFAVQL